MDNPQLRRTRRFGKHRNRRKRAEPRDARRYAVV
jgi:hypothetical protein